MLKNRSRTSTSAPPGQAMSRTATSLPPLNSTSVPSVSRAVLVRKNKRETEAIEGSASPRNPRDRKSTRLNSSHTVISYAVFCLKKKKKNKKNNHKNK